LKNAILTAYAQVMPKAAAMEFPNEHRCIRPGPSSGAVSDNGSACEKYPRDHAPRPFSAERTSPLIVTEAERTRRLIEILAQVQASTTWQSPRIAIKAKGRILFVSPSELVAVEAQGNYVLLQRQSGSYLLRESISVMAEKLQPMGFIRIHRSILVNSSFVEEIQPCSTGEYAIRLKGGKEYTVTRTYKANLKCLAESWIGTDSFVFEQRVPRFSPLLNFSSSIHKPVTVELNVNGDSINVAANALNAKISGKVLLLITEDRMSTEVKAGENRSEALHHNAVVRSLENLGKLRDGAFSRTVTLRLKSDWQRDKLHAVVLIQDNKDRIMGAGTASVISSTTATQ
jgi:hypothetical protein